MKRFLGLLAMLMVACFTEAAFAQPSLPLPWRKGVEKKEAELKDDVGQVGAKVDQVNGKVDRLGAISAAPPAVCQVPSGPDAGTLAALNQHARDIEGLKAGLGATAQQVAQLEKSVDALPKSLAQQFAENRAKEQAEEPAAPKVKQDLDALKVTMGNWLYAVVALLVALVVGLIVWNILHNKGLARQQIDAFAKANPNNQQAQTLAKQVDTTEDQWKANLLSALPFLAKLPGVTQPGAAGPVAGVAAHPAAAAPVAAPAAGGDATNAAVTAALVSGAIQTALATPVPAASAAAPLTVSATTTPLPAATPPVVAAK